METTTSSKEAQSSGRERECCMCGDHGFREQLFRCKVCHFRSQHRYCSNLYPEAESYKVCNWCLIQKADSDLDHKSLPYVSKYSPPPLLSSHKVSSSADNGEGKSNSGSGCPKGQRRCEQPAHVSTPVKKQRPPATEERSVQATSSKRVGSNGCEEKGLRGTRSEEVSNKPTGAGVSLKQVAFRNKARRYKLLDEVSS